MHLALHALLENLDRATDMVFAKRNMWLDWLLFGIFVRNSDRTFGSCMFNISNYLGKSSHRCHLNPSLP